MHNRGNGIPNFNLFQQVNRLELFSPSDLLPF